MNRWMDKWNAVYTYDGILFSLLKRGNSDVILKDIKLREMTSTVWFHLQMRYLEQSNSQRQKVQGWCQGLREKNEELVLSGYRVSVLQDERSLEMVGGDGLHNHELHITEHLLWLIRSSLYYVYFTTIFKRLVKKKVVLVTKSCPTLLWPPRTVACQFPLSMGFSKQECWNGLPFPSPEDLPNPGIKPVSLVSLALVGVLFTTAPTGKPESYTFKNL